MLRCFFLKRCCLGAAREGSMEKMDWPIALVLSGLFVIGTFIYASYKSQEMDSAQTEHLAPLPLKNTEVESFYRLSGLDYLQVGEVVLGDKTACSNMPFLDMDSVLTPRVAEIFVHLEVWQQIHGTAYRACGHGVQLPMADSDAGGIALFPE